MWVSESFLLGSILNLGFDFGKDERTISRELVPKCDNLIDVGTQKIETRLVFLKHSPFSFQLWLPLSEFCAKSDWKKRNMCVFISIENHSTTCTTFILLMVQKSGKLTSWGWDPFYLPWFTRFLYIQPVVVGGLEPRPSGHAPRCIVGLRLGWLLAPWPAVGVVGRCWTSFFFFRW